MDFNLNSTTLNCQDLAFIGVSCLQALDEINEPGRSYRTSDRTGLVLCYDPLSLCHL